MTELIKKEWHCRVKKMYCSSVFLAGPECCLHLKMADSSVIAALRQLMHYGRMGHTSLLCTAYCNGTSISDWIYPVT